MRDDFLNNSRLMNLIDSIEFQTIISRSKQLKKNQLIEIET